MSCNLPSCSVSRAALIGGIAGADLSTPAYDHWGAVLWSAVRASPLVCAELVVASLCMALVAADAAGCCCAAIKYPTLPGWPSRRPGNLAAVMPSPETISVISSKHPRRAIVSGWVLERSSMSCLRIDEGAVKDESLTHVWIVVLAGVSRRGDSSLLRVLSGVQASSSLGCGTPFACTVLQGSGSLGCPVSVFLAAVEWTFSVVGPWPRCEVLRSLVPRVLARSCPPLLLLLLLLLL